jgi:predicted HTH domain antitoxin
MRWELEQLNKLSEEQPELADAALSVLWKHQPEVLRRVIIGAYLDQRISLSKAAELIGVTRLELQRQFLQQGIPVRTLTADEVKAEVEALRQGQQTA